MSSPPRKPGGPGGAHGPRSPHAGPRPPHAGPRPPSGGPSRSGAPRPAGNGQRPAGNGSRPFSLEGRSPSATRQDERAARPQEGRASGSGPRQAGPRKPEAAAGAGSHPPRPFEARPPGPRPDGPRPDGPRQDGPRPAYTNPDSHHGAPRPASRTPETPRGAVWLYGLHAVDAALGNPARRLRRLILTEEAEAALAARRPQPWSLAPERSDRGRIDQLLGRDVVHQGAALLADPLATPLLAAALEKPGPILVLDQVTDPRNIGAVLRSAAAFGAACVITQDRNAPEETGALAKAASGALELVPLIRAVNLARTLVALKASGVWTVGLDAGGQPLSGAALAERRVALVLGAEGSGLRRLVRETCDEVAGLAMPGSMESLNVSAAATVALYELGRRG